MELRSVPCKSAISKSSLPGLNYTFNPYLGCQHGCLYCYVPDILRHCALPPEWGREVMVKEGVLRLLASDLRRLKPGTVGVSTVTDPYQPAERTHCLTRQALSILRDSGFQVSVQTKSALVARDFDLMKGRFELGMTITSMDDDFRRLFEPSASPPEERASTLEEASSRGIKTWIFYGPIIPLYNDSIRDAAKIIELAERTKSHILYDRLNIKPLMLQRMKRSIPDEAINSIKNADLKKTFSYLEAECRSRGVHCKFAF
jgi:DNA repair photolyase